MPHLQRLNLALALGAGALFVVGVGVLIPWSDLPSGAVPASSVFTSSELHTLRSYASAQRHVVWMALAVQVVVALALALIPQVRRTFGRIPGPISVQVLAGSALVVLVAKLATLPWQWWAFQNARDAGVSVSSTGLWWRDVAVSTVVSWVPLALALVVVVHVVRRYRQMWPLVLGAVAAAAVVVTSLIYPVVIAPLFSSTHPLPKGPLRTAILQLADREGVHLDDVVVADASTRTTAENAQVTGFGPTERVVLDDTLLRSMDQREIEVVVGHELGHAVNHDVLVGTLLGSLGAFAGVGLLGFVVIRRGWATVLVRPTVVPVLFAGIVIGALLMSPLELSMSRAVEARADRAALAATHDPAAFVTAQKQLNLAARLDPTPPAWSQFWFGSHPTVLERIWLAR